MLFCNINMSKANLVNAYAMMDEVPERLLAYYLQKRLNGMSYEEIAESMRKQMLQPPAVELAIKTINRMEVLQKNRNAGYAMPVSCLSGASLWALPVLP